MLSNIYRNIGLEKEAEKVTQCGVDIPFCNDPLCARCNTLKDRELRDRVDNVINSLSDKYDVVTVNLGCYAVEPTVLDLTMTNITNAVMGFLRRKEITSISFGTARIMHIRLAKGKESFRPFITLFLLVNKGYTVENSEVKEIWKQCMKTNSDLKVGVCHYKKVDIIYPVNTLKLLGNDFSVIVAANKSIKNRKLVTFTGELKRRYSELYSEISTEDVLDNLLK